MPYGYKQPSNWGAIKKRVLVESGGVCYICGALGANQVDHVVPVSQGGTHDEGNLAACHATPCHAAKSEAERREGWARRRPRHTTTRRPESHPGKLE